MTRELPADALDVVIAAGEAGGREEFLFLVANRSAVAASYDRASVWSLSSRPRLQAVSGGQPADPRAAFAVVRSAVLRRLKDRGKARLLGAESFSDPAPWKKLAAENGGVAALWVPMPRHGVAVLYERWAGATFSPDDADALRRVAGAMDLVSGRKRTNLAGRSLRWIVWLALFAAVAFALWKVRLPLRVVAVCEVAARNPRLIAAPMDGVIDQVLVAPGDRVAAGDRLALYDSRLMEEELKISRRQVAVVEAELAGARARGFSDARYRGETALLEARLEQENARLEALEVRFAGRVVVAPVGGMVQLDDARAWRGRPVSTGQAMLWIVDPADTRVKLWLPQDDRIEFDMKRPIYVHLHAMGGEGRAARLTYVSTFAQPTPDGNYAFPAEAEWIGAESPPPLGLRGSASIHGEETSLGYWLLRRPLAWFRRWLGV